MTPCRVHITGASGSGVSTLGRALAQSWSVPFHDVDDYFWEPTEPPFVIKRAPARRLDLMQHLFLPRGAWVLAGSLMGWGDPLIPYFDRVIFLRADKGVRLQRLRHREAQRYGPQALEPGGKLHEQNTAFMDWASRYDDPTFTGRSLARHQAWLATLPGGFLELSSGEPVQQLLDQALGA